MHGARVRELWRACLIRCYWGKCLLFVGGCRCDLLFFLFRPVVSLYRSFDL